MALPPVTPEWMRMSEAATRLQVDRKTVRNRLESGRLPVRVLRLDGILRLNRHDFDAFIEKAATVGLKSA